MRPFTAIARTPRGAPSLGAAPLNNHDNKQATASENAGAGAGCLFGLFIFVLAIGQCAQQSEQRASNSDPGPTCDSGMTLCNNEMSESDLSDLEHALDEDRATQPVNSAH